MVTEFHFHSLPWVHLIWAAPLVFLATLYGISRRARMLRVFGVDLQRDRAWLASSRRRRILKAALLSAALFFLVAAAIQPRCNPEKKRFKTTARDLAVCLDVSKSMLADDLKPSRLERAKLELSRLADALEGDRIGLVVFAGDAVIKCPLTSNYSYFKNTLRTISYRSTSQGGTKIGDAIRKALSDLLGVDKGERAPEEGKKVGETVMEDEARGRKETYADILIITDGEDHDSYPMYAARRAGSLNVGIYTVGLGSEAGSRIPVPGESRGITYLQYEGSIVESRMNAKLLMEMSTQSSRGAYLPVGIQNFDLVDFHAQTIGRDTGREVTEEEVFWTEIFQPFLFAGLLCLLVSLLIPERPARAALAVEEAAS